MTDFADFILFALDRGKDVKLVKLPDEGYLINGGLGVEIDGVVFRE